MGDPLHAERATFVGRARQCHLGLDVRAALRAGSPLSRIPSGGAIGYGYDANGNRTSVTTATGTTHFGFDALNRLHTVTDRLAQVSTYNYDSQTGALQTLSYPNGTTTTYGYQQQSGRLQSIAHASTSTFASFTYGLSPTGRRDSIDEVIDGTSSHVDYSYDDLDRLTGEIRTGANAYTIGFTYDDVGNRLDRPAPAGRAATTTTNATGCRPRRSSSTARAAPPR